jgi:hypothetical protein
MREDNNFTLEKCREHMQQYVLEGKELIVKWTVPDLEGEEIFTMYEEFDGCLLVNTFHIDAFDDDHGWRNPDWGCVNEMRFDKDQLESMLKFLEA